ncbi:MAG: glycerophosphodiester phosphodiesterase family protein [Planctomycetota bacterium]|nr:glycerophosphodiester phosphodiesterase family protein [Planctomycetota bacterium]
MSTLFYGHRGASGVFPENTLLAFDAAFKAGVQAIETDIRFTKDQRIMVCHDEDGLRMCNEKAAVKNTPYSEIRKWDAGWGFVDKNGERPFAGQGVTFPTMEELINRYKEAPINVDIKEATASDIKRLIEVVRDNQAEDRVLLTSFSSARVNVIRKLGYNGPIGFGLRQIVSLYFVPRILLKLVRQGDRVQIPQEPVGPFKLSASWFINKCHKMGLPVDFWVVNDVNRARELIKLGADGIMSDFPGDIVPALQSSQS